MTRTLLAVALVALFAGCSGTSEPGPAPIDLTQFDELEGDVAAWFNLQPGAGDRSTPMNISLRGAIPPGAEIVAAQVIAGGKSFELSNRGDEVLSLADTDTLRASLSRVKPDQRTAFHAGADLVVTIRDEDGTETTYKVSELEITEVS